MDIEKLEKNLKLRFKNKELVKTAFTHTSYANENKVQSNEKLEYLGDSILEFITSKYLYYKYKNMSEGEMTKLRATVVCEDSLYEIAKRYDFTKFLLLGKSERASSDKNKKAIMADSVEALIAAMYIDLGIEKTEEFIIYNLSKPIEIASKNVGMKEYKTVLQEKLQEKGDVKIIYEIISENGPDHDKTFTAQVSVNGKKLAKGTGKSKKMAEMDAARQALKGEKKYK